MSEIRLGTIGSGSIVCQILDNVLKTDGICLKAVYSRTLEAGRKLADKYGTDVIFTDIDEFLDSEYIDTVYVASPNNLHFYYTKKAILAGKNVICEKPFVPSLEEAEELVRLADDKGVLLVEAVPTSFLPNFRVLVDNLDKIGRIKLVQANYSQYSSRFDNLLAGDVTNVFNPEFAGGCLMDINYYNVYLTAALFGTPLKAEYHPNLYDVKALKHVDANETFQSGDVIDTSGVMVMEYEGFTAVLNGAKDTWGVNFYQIEGEKGYIYAAEGGNGMVSVRVVTKDSDETINMQSEGRLYYEVQELTRIYKGSSREELKSRLEIMFKAVEIVENSRKAAGISFSCDK